jgi:hypothetical protein
MSKSKTAVFVRLPTHLRVKLDWLKERKAVSYNGVLCLALDALYDAERIREAQESIPTSEAA